MFSHEKDCLVEKYLKEKFEELNKKKTGFISEEKFESVKKEYINRKEDYIVLKSEIDNRIKAALKEEEKIVKNHKTIEKNITFNEIKDAYQKLTDSLENANEKVYVAGGALIYLITDEESNRFHSDIDTICKIEDINDIRNLLKKTPYYLPNWDSLNYETNNIDYGLEIKIDNVPIGIYPFLYKDNEILQYTFDPYNKLGKTKL